MGVQHFKGVCILPNTNHLPLLGPTATLYGALKKEAEKDGITSWEGDENDSPSGYVCACFLSSIQWGRAKGHWKMFLEEQLPTNSNFPNTSVSGTKNGCPESSWLQATGQWDHGALCAETEMVPLWLPYRNTPGNHFACFCPGDSYRLLTVRQ